ncbi:hypothetical protein [Halosimplex halophilum]|uniref:hypothetical protein n=1 Tax=Halosimplex halophilum TaxID=2559572 RepID=UPI00107FB1B3|nr:hypothetical protein [Halosimplex halophilum]
MEATDESVEGGRARVEPNEGAGGPEFADCPAIAAHAATETRTVFTEDGNGDGWIATDLTVEIRE